MAAELFLEVTDDRILMNGEDVTAEDWRLTLDTNVEGAMICARTCLPHMLARGRGRILSATSIVARTGNYGQTAYAAVESAVKRLRLYDPPSRQGLSKAHLCKPKFMSALRRARLRRRARV